MPYFNIINLIYNLYFILSFLVSSFIFIFNVFTKRERNVDIKTLKKNLVHISLFNIIFFYQFRSFFLLQSNFHLISSSIFSAALHHCPSSPLYCVLPLFTSLTITSIRFESHKFVHIIIYRK